MSSISSGPTDAKDIVLSCYLSDDFKDRVRALLEKRKPTWQGRQTAS